MPEARTVTFTRDCVPPPSSLNYRTPDGCTCNQAWSSTIGHTCPVHGFIDVIHVTCA